MSQNAIPQNRTYKITFQAHQGSTLAMTAVIAVVLIAMMGVGIYLGLQAYLQGEVQKAAGSAAMVGASAMYHADGAVPEQDSGRASGVANQAIGVIQGASPALQKFGFTASASAGGEDEVRVQARAIMQTDFLKVLQLPIDQVEVNAVGRARSVAYVPTQYQQVVLSATGERGVMLMLDQPFANRDGVDIYVEQGAVTNRQRYYVDACTSQGCIPINEASITPHGGGRLRGSNDQGGAVVDGSALIDAKLSGVNKATRLRFVHPQNYWAIDIGPNHYLDSIGQPIRINKVKIWGFGSLCPPQGGGCQPPKGFESAQGV